MLLIREDTFFAFNVSYLHFRIIRFFWISVRLHKQNFPDEEVPPATEIFKNPETFNDAFAIFTCAQALVDHPEAVKLAVSNVLKEFIEDNVAYIELRSTPRSSKVRDKDIS